MKKEQREIYRATRIISFSILLSRIFGYVRDYIIAFFFGASTETDAFFVAYQIPNLFRRLFGEGTLSSALVPILTEKEHQKGRKETIRYANIVLTNLIFVTLLLVMIGILFAKPFVYIQAPGFKNDVLKFNTTVHLLKIIFPYLIFIIAAAWAMGFLNTLNIFGIPALSTAVFNISVIIAIIFFYRIMGLHTVDVLAYSVLFAVIIQFAFHIPKMISAGYRFKFIGLFTREIIPLVKLMTPAFISMAVFQFNILVDRIIASFLPTGSISYLYYANRLMQLPLGIFGIAYSIAALPTFSKLSMNNQKDKILEGIDSGFRFISVIMLPVMFVYFAFGANIINFLFGYGKFRATNAAFPTYTALIFYSIGLPAYAQVKLINSYYFAKKDIKLPAIIGIASMLVNLILNLIFIKYFSFAGLALATSLSSYFSFFVLGHFVSRELGTIISPRFVSFFLKVILASVLSSGLATLITIQINIHVLIALALNAIFLFVWFKILGIRELTQFLFKRTS